MDSVVLSLSASRLLTSPYPMLNPVSDESAFPSDLDVPPSVDSRQRHLTGHGRCTEDRCQALPRVLCQDRRGRARGLPVRDEGGVVEQEQEQEEGRMLGPLSAFSVTPCASSLPPRRV